jgi:hypothetical protein
MSRQCPRCGKVLRSGSEEAMRAHQRESESCFAQSGKGESSAVTALAERLRKLIDEGRKLGTGTGTFEDTQRNAKERAQVEAQLKQARKETKREKQAVKDLAAASMSAANWTQHILQGDSRFSKGEASVEHRLAQETVGLVTSSEFKAKKEALEAEAVRKEREDEERAAAKRAAAEVERKARKKRQRQEQASKLSFADEDE